MTTISIRWGLACAVVALAAAGCGSKKRDDAGKGAGTATTATAGNAIAAADASAAGATIVDAAPAPAPKPIAQDQLAIWYSRCWSYFNRNAWLEFRACYADDASFEGPPPMTGADAMIAEAKAMKRGFPDLTGEQQLTLVHGDTIVSITLLRGTNTGPMMAPDGQTMPPSRKKVGVMVAQILQTNPAGKAIKETLVMDTRSFVGQLGGLPAGTRFRPTVLEGWKENQVVLARDDANEDANVAAYERRVAAFNAHDRKAVEAGLAADLVWSEAAMVKDQTRAELLKGLGGMWAAFSDLKMNPTWTWGAGEYVVSRGTMTGTNDGKSAALGLDRTGKKIEVPYVEIDHVADGKVDKAWLFFDSAVFATQLGLAAPGAGP